MILFTAVATFAWALPRMRPTARSGSSSVSFFSEYLRSDGMPLGPSVNVGTRSSSPMIVT